MRGGLLLGFSLVAASVTRPAFADTACVDAYDQSQRSRRSGKLIEAREQLLVCATERCPAAVSKDCTRWLREVNLSLPTVVFGARDASGQDVTDVRVTAAERVLADGLDGRAVPLDPGPYTLRFELGDGRVVEKPIVVREGEKNRLIELSVPPARETLSSKPTPEPPPEPSTKRERAVAEPDAAGVPTLAWVLGAVGIVGLGSFVYFALDARSDVQDMESSCAPSCAQDRVDTAERKALIADISLGVGVAALAGAGVVILTRPRGGAQGAVVTFGSSF